MKTVAIVQARMGSSRLPGKVLMPINGTPMIGLLLQRLAQSTEIDEIVVATSSEVNNDPLHDYVTELGYACFRGSELDVLSRFAMVAEATKAEVIVRITGDCPLVDAALIDDMLERFAGSNVDYLNNCDPPSFPNGLDAEIMTRDALVLAHENAVDQADREHVTPYLRWKDTVHRGQYVNKTDLSAMRWTVDELSDFEVVKGVFDYFAPKVLFSWHAICELAERQPQIFKPNAHLRRNEGMHLSENEKKARFAKNQRRGRKSE